MCEWTSELRALQPTYWKQWEVKVSAEFNEHEVRSLSSRYLEAFRDYLDQGPRRRPDGTALADLLALHNLEAKICHELNVKWARLKEPAGVIELVNLHAFHFTVRDRQNGGFLKDWHEPCRGSLYLAVDFKQHDTLPVGPPRP